MGYSGLIVMSHSRYEVTQTLIFLSYYYKIMSDIGLVFLEAQEAQFDWTYMGTSPDR